MNQGSFYVFSTDREQFHTLVHMNPLSLRTYTKINYGPGMVHDQESAYAYAKDMCSNISYPYARFIIDENGVVIYAVCLEQSVYERARLG
jgi:hypothetical protein